MNAAVIDEREDLLKTLAKHIIDDGYRYGNQTELKLLVANKLGHDLPEAELKKLEKHIKEMRAGHV